MLIVVYLSCMGSKMDTTYYGIRDGLPGSVVGGGVQDNKGLIWFATWNGLYCHDGYEFHRVSIRPGDRTSIGTDRIRDIVLSDDDNIVCHTDNDIFIFNLSTYAYESISDSIKSRLATVVGHTWKGLTDGNNNRWETSNNGLRKISKIHHPAESLKESLGLHPRSMTNDESGGFIVGTRADKTLRFYDKEKRMYKETKLQHAPYCLTRHSSGDLWIGCKPGALLKHDGTTISTDNVYDIKEDRYGRLWIATFGNGIICCPNPTDSMPSLSQPSCGGKIRKIYISNDDNLIAATSDGLLAGHIDPKSDKISLKHIRRDGHDASSLASNSLMSVCGDSRGNIFIATESSGIDLIDEKLLFSDKPEFTHIEELPRDLCKAMTIVGDSLLLAVGNNKVSAYNINSRQTTCYSEMFWGHSCHFTEATPIVLSDGSWLLGTDECAVTATPHNLESRGFIPSLVFTTLSKNGEAEIFCMPPVEELKLGADERNISIGFSALDYSTNQNIVYRSRIDKSPWTVADKSRKITLFNLSQGKHIIEIQSTDRYGRWVDNKQTLTVSVAPLWHETWWAKLLFILIAAGIISGIIYIRNHIRHIEQERHILLEKYLALINDNKLKQKETAIPPTQKHVSDTELAAVTDDKNSPLLNRVREYIELNLCNPEANVDDMASHAAASRSTLNRHLRSQLGITAAKLLTESRLRRAEQLLSTSETSIHEIATACGYADTQYFQRVFRNSRGMSPGEYRNQSKADPKGRRAEDSE